jgi:hypothetical protein
MPVVRVKRKCFAVRRKECATVAAPFCRGIERIFCIDGTGTSRRYESRERWMPEHESGNKVAIFGVFGVERGGHHVKV